MKIYLASPWFKENEKKLYKEVIDKLRADGFEVYVPMEHKIEDEWLMTNEEWGKSVFNEDLKAIQECDEVWVLNFGLYSDSGTAWECGYAYGLKKRVFMFVNDYDKENNYFRDIDDVFLSKNVYSLMMANGCTKVENISTLLTDNYSPLNIEVK